MIYALPGTSFAAFTEPGAFDAGLVGTIGLRVEAPDNVVKVPRSTSGIVDLSNGVYAAAGVIAPTTQGEYAVIWDDDDGNEAVEVLSVVGVLPTAFLPTTLITLDEVKVALDIPLTETAKDAKLSAAIVDAEAAVKAATGRTFDQAEDPSPGPSARTFEFTESGIVVVDDFQHDSLTGIAVDGTDLSADQWVVHPYGSEYPVAWWLEVLRTRPASPEMGFTRNEDVLAAEGLLASPFAAATKVTVTAVWGWVGVPADVRRATLWTAIAFQDQPRSLISESIGGMSRSYANPMTAGLPERAQALLAPHTKAQ